MMPLVYYLLIRPLSLLPLWILYRLSDLAYLIIYRLLGYRKKVVFDNLRKALPDKSEAEIKRIARLFYQHLCDLIVESIRMFQMSEKEAIQRFQVANPHVLDNIFYDGKSVIIASAHYNNWELATLSPGLQLQHKYVSIYTPLKNQFMDQKIRESRSRYGSPVVPKQDVDIFFEDHLEERIAPLFAADQSPGNPDKAYWTNFLNQDTPVAFGPEKYAKKYNLPVVFAGIRKIKRGHYEAELELLCEDPSLMEYGAITDLHVKALEKEILEQPEFWLWSHRRWKHKRGENVSKGKT